MQRDAERVQRARYGCSQALSAVNEPLHACRATSFAYDASLNADDEISDAGGVIAKGDGGTIQGNLEQWKTWIQMSFPGRKGLALCNQGRTAIVLRCKARHLFSCAGELASIRARRARLTDSEVVKTSATSWSRMTVRAAKRLGCALR